ncbi:hypothetical protein FRC12_004518 [Ceratobasidium sp. 428]|nr:hypothetical protein FRC12_004518 [Ceratobasidium sp. 428]
MGRLLRAGFAALVALQANAEPRSNATCINQQWSFNSLQQSPCLVSAYLSAQCTSDNNWLVPEIGTQGPVCVFPLCRVRPSLILDRKSSTRRLRGIMPTSVGVTHYNGTCCLSAPFVKADLLEQWTGGCSLAVTNVGRYPLSAPGGTVIPHWAYYDFTGTGVFDAIIASQQTGPESSPPAVASSTRGHVSVVETATAIATTRLPASPSATPLPSVPKSNSSSNNIGAIVGGAVGGVLGLAVLILVVVIRTRQSKQSSSKNERYASGGYRHPMAAQPTSAAPMSQYKPDILHPGTPGPDKSNDPSDPTTFPAPQTYAFGQYTRSLSYSQQPSQYQPRQHGGAPEV